jgi:hypothetical protein
MDKNGNLTSVDTYDSDFEIEEIEEQTDEHFKRIKELMNDDISVDFTDDEFREMLGYIIGYTSEEIGDDYRQLREDLIEEVKSTTGKDLTKCWIWM